MARLSLTLLGGFEARLDAGPPLAFPTRKAQALLAYLALPLGRTHPRDKLAALLWGDLPAAQARSNLRHTLFVLRRLLAATDRPVVRLDGETVALDLAAVEVDAVAFELRVTGETTHDLERAVALYGGDLLAGLDLNEAPFEEWLLAERERLREVALDVTAKLLAHQRSEGATPAAIQTALRFLALDPLQEAVHRTLMRLYVRLGRRGAALRQYQACTSVLERELGVEPEADTKALYREILRRQGPPGATAVPALGAELEHASGPDRSHAEDRLPETPLVDRERESVLLRQTLEEAWAGRGRLVTILGEAGIGKSRLVAELISDAVTRGGRVLLGRCRETEQIFAFGPWIDALRSGHVARDLTGAPGLDPVWRRELARLLPEIGAEGLSAGSEPPEYLRLFESVARCIAHLAHAQPLCVVLEDLQWADEMSLRLLGFINQRFQRWPVLVAATIREEELTDTPFLRHVLEDLGREPHVVTIRLAPLSERDTVTLMKALVRSGSDAATMTRLGEQVWRVSDGNPFIVVEAIRALGEGTPPEGTASLPQPQRLRELIARRLERIGERGQALVTAAAIIGREFDFAFLQRVSGLEEAEAAEGVEELVRRQVLHGLGERFDFTHDAIRTLVLSQILAPRARLLHRRGAEALESLHAGNLESSYAALGRHYREAEVWERAVEYLRLAGTQALTRSAHREALAWFEQARAALGHLPKSPEALAQATDLLIDLYHALLPLGDGPRAAPYLREAEAFARALDDRVRLGWILAYATNCAWLSGDSARAVAYGAQALALAETLGDLTLQVVARFYLGQVSYFRGEYRQAIDVLRRNVSMLERDGPGRFGLPGLPAALSRGWLAWSLAEVGEFVEAMACGEEAVRMAESADHAFTRADAYRELGCLYLTKGHIPDALRMLERGLDLCRARDLGLWVPSIGSVLGYAYALDGRLAEGTALLEQSVEQAASLGIGAGHALRNAWLAETYLLAGRLTDARGLAERALDLAREHEERGHEAWVLRLFGEIAAHSDPPDAELAEAQYGMALALGGELGMRPFIARCHLGLGALCRRTGRSERAREHLATAMTMYREMDMQFWLEKAETDLKKSM